MENSRRIQPRRVAKGKVELSFFDTENGDT